MSMKNRIKLQRLLLNMTLEDVAKVVGVTRATIQKYESGAIENIPKEKIKLLATALKTTPSYLLGWDDEPSLLELTAKDNGLEGAVRLVQRSKNILPIPKMVKKPRLGSIACGKPILAVEEADEFDFVPEDIVCDFTLRCKGDSMIDARICDGDIVYIRSQPEVENGQIAAVRVGDEATLKKVYYNGGRIILRACNPLYADMEFEGERVNEMEVLGLAVGFTSIIRPK